MTSFTSLGKDKPSIIMVGPSVEARGGVSTVVRELIAGGIGEYCDFKYIPTVVDGSRLRKLLKAIIAYIEFSLLLPKYDIVHIHMSLRASFARKRLFFKKAKRLGKPVVLHIHEGEFANLFSNASEKKRAQIIDLLVKADSLIALSEEWGSFFSEITNGEASVIVLHNGIVLPEVASCSKSDPNVLFLGRLDARKSPDVLLRASKTIIDKHPNIILHFCGDGEIDKSRKLASSLGIDANCEFHGWLVGQELEAIMRDCGIFCLPSKNEGMPMSLLEAMARGFAVIVTPVGGIPQVVEDHVNGLLCEVDDVASFSRALDELVDDQELRLRLGNAARTTIEESFSVNSNIRVLVELYNTLLENRER